MSEQIGDATLYLGDCFEILPTLEADSIDAVVTDPPYGLSFMGKAWDKGVPSVDVWSEVLRVLKPGGHLLAFAGTRTQHRMASAIEDAGFEIRDMIAWVYGSGFPKSLDVSKAIDKAAGAERKVVSEGRAVKRMIPGADQDKTGSWIKDNGRTFTPTVTRPATDDAEKWQGWGTALKPALEPITVARKPFKGTVAANVLEHSTGAINVDGCRVGTDEVKIETSVGGARMGYHGGASGTMRHNGGGTSSPQGRFPANLIHDGSDEVVRLFPDSKAPKPYKYNGAVDDDAEIYGKGIGRGFHANEYADTGSAARFFYCPKSSKRDRDEGCEGLEEKGRNEVYGAGMNTATKCDPAMGHTPESVESRPLRRNNHPTVKPTDLMRYLVRLVTPPGGVVLDPYMGSGSTGKAAMLEGFRFVGIDISEEYTEIARARIAADVRATLTQREGGEG